MIEESILPRSLFWWMALFAIVVSVGARAPQMRVPFERDEGAYAYVAQVVAQGGLPYRDAFDHKPPGVYYVYHLSFRIFGNSVYAPRLMAIFFAAAACLVVFLIVYRATSSRLAGMLAMSLLAFACASPAYSGFTANTEIFVLPFLAGACLLLMAEQVSGRRCLVAGLAYGTALIIKQVVLPVALASLLYILIKNRFRMKTILVRAAVPFFAGMLLPCLLVATYFHLLGAFDSFWMSVWEFNRSYATNVRPADAWKNFLNSGRFILSLDPASWLAAYAGLISCWYHPVRRPYFWFVTAPLIGCCAGIALGGYFFPHYYLIMLPYLTIVAGIGSTSLILPKIRSAGIWLLALLVAGCVAIGWRFSAKPGDKKLEVVYGHNLFDRSITVGRFLRAQASRGASLYILGSEPQIYFYADMFSTTRFFYFYPLMQPSPHQAAFRSELLTELRRHPPDYLVRVNDPSSLSLLANASDPFIMTLSGEFSGYRPVGISAARSNGEILTDPEALSSPARLDERGSIVIYQKR